MNTNETQKGKAGSELHKNALCYFEQTLEATCHKTAIVQSPTSYLTNHPNKMNKTCKVQFYIDSYTMQCWPTSKDLHISALCGYWMTYQEQWMIKMDLRPPTSYLTNHPSKMNKTCRVLFYMDSYTWTQSSVGQPVRTYLYQFCVDTWWPTRSNGW